MPVPFGLLRGMLGLLCLFFAHFLGRSWIRFRRGSEKISRLIAWTLRTVVTLLGVLWFRPLDAFAIVVIVLGAVSLAAGLFLEWQPKHEEDLTRTIFPE
jgi:hypothetical protein